MPLEAGQTIAHYRLVEKIGEGGMGVVWKADDTKLGRQVAIKILPEAFARDAERMARFGREAQVLASLNHPNVAAIYGLEEQGPLRALVLELVDGETLSERISRGPVPPDEALPLAAQIAAAMEAAHATGTIHRDLKPANVKVTEKGVVKVLDFGLAKALIGDPAASPDSTQSPTMTASPTQAGIILGTAPYMSPEQARGKAVDRRADVWAFGVILYEMLTGRRLFAGETITDILAAVVRAEPEWEKLPPATPPAIRKLLRRCLSKDPERRLRDFGDILLELTEAAEEPVDSQAGSEAAPAALTPRPLARRLAGPALALLLVLATAIGAWTLSGSRREDPFLVASVLPPEGTRFHLSLGGPGVPALSPDGRMLAFTADAENGPRALYVRPLDSPEAYRLTGTESAQYPFWSPDGRHLGFFSRSDQKLKKISVAGGAPVALCDAENAKGGTWSADGIIVFTPGPSKPLLKVREAGGIPEELTQLDASTGEASHRHPQFLPGGDRILFFIHRSGDSRTADSLAVVGIDGGPITPILESKVGARYASGHLLFVRDEVLMAQPFDPDRLTLYGDPVPVAGNVGILGGAYKAVFSASANGRLAFIPRVPSSAGALRKVAPEGGKSEPIGDEAAIGHIAVSPDGTKVALDVTDPVSGTSDIWIHDLERGLRSRVTFELEDEEDPVWSHDGKHVYYSSEEAGWNRIMVKATSGFGDAEIAVEWNSPARPMSVSPDGQWLVFRAQHPANDADLWVFPLHDGDEPYQIVGSKTVDTDGIVSPDGRWMAYMSIESGRPEIYITSFPRAGSKWQVSISGGDNPSWSHDGKRLYFQDREGMILSVSIQAQGESLAIGRPAAVVQSWMDSRNYRYGVLPDGKILLVERVGGEEGAPVTLILNWPRMLEQGRGR